jgi:hypothetical protein
MCAFALRTCSEDKKEPMRIFTHRFFSFAMYSAYDFFCLFFGSQP